MITVKSVETAAQKKAFIDFPHTLYADDPHYVPELHVAQADMLNPKKHPFFKYGNCDLFLAYKDGKIAGRIAAINNPRYVEAFNRKVAFFGFYDTIDDIEVAQLLMQKVAEFAKSYNYTGILGPTNFTTNDTAGMLVEGFDSPPMLMMTHTKPYASKLMDAMGFQKDMDLYAYLIETAKASERTIKLAQSIEKRLQTQGITIRNINLKKIDQEAPKLFEIYNEAWSENWGFVPFTDAEFEFLKNDLKLIADARWIYIAEKDGEPIGFGLTLPNINEILARIKRGRLLPTGIFKLLLGKKSVKTVRILALGVKKEYRKKGIEAIFFAKNILQARESGIWAGEASWVLESNEEMVAAAEHLNGRRYKTYRLYCKNI